MSETEHTRQTQSVGTSQPQIENRFGISRRNLLKGALGAAATLALPQHGAEARINTYEVNQAIENEITPIQGDGWNFFVDLDDIEAYSRTNGSTVEIDLSKTYGTSASRIIYKNGIKDMLDSNFIRVPIEGVSTGVLEILPNLDDNLVHLSIRETKNGETTNHVDADVEIACHTPPHGNEKRIFSEEALSDEVLDLLGEESKRFDVFQSPSFPTFIFTPRYGVQTPIQNSEENYVKIPTKYFSNPELVPQGMIVLNHEWFHAIHEVDPLLMSTQVVEADALLLQTHGNLWEYLSGKPYDSMVASFAPKDIMESPAFLAFDESTYYPELKAVTVQDHGHPFSNYREFFASSMNCMGRSGGEVIANIEAITDQELKSHAIELAATTLALADAIAGDAEKVTATFPGIKMIREYLETT